MGGWIVAAQPARWLAPRVFFHLPPGSLTTDVSGLAGQALLAWLVAAIPAVALMTATLTLMLRRIPAVRTAEAGD